MPNDDRTKIIYSRTPQSAAMLANVKRSMAITAALNRLTFNDADEIRALFRATNHLTHHRQSLIIRAWKTF